ncbi:hypothetical protein I312_105874 [Cryptococcus bacillisporus CA1280]|uniref:uncharacterized protein n=1 Tax=Cryptococcus bacillisporus CA1280 TaxID=1296109 RepID=UPI00336872FB
MLLENGPSLPMALTSVTINPSSSFSPTLPSSPFTLQFQWAMKLADSSKAPKGLFRMTNCYKKTGHLLIRC